MKVQLLVTIEVDVDMFQDKTPNDLTDEEYEQVLLQSEEVLLSMFKSMGGADYDVIDYFLIE